MQESLTLLLIRLWGESIRGKYRALEYVTKGNFETGGQFSERIDHTQALHLSNGALFVGRQRRPLAGADTNSAKQFKTLILDLLKEEGIMRYQDAYSYAEAAVKELPDSYTDLFSSRFKYVFVDEYQDCDLAQRQAIDALFNPEKCTVIKIGDFDKAIYNSADNVTPDWIPTEGFLPIQSSCRYSQEIADAIFCLRKDNSRIVSSTVSGQVMKDLQLAGEFRFRIIIQLYTGDVLYFLRANSFAKAFQGIEEAENLGPA